MRIERITITAISSMSVKPAFFFCLWGLFMGSTVAVDDLDLVDLQIDIASVVAFGEYAEAQLGDGSGAGVFRSIIHSFLEGTSA